MGVSSKVYPLTLGIIARLDILGVVYKSYPLKTWFDYESYPVFPTGYLTLQADREVCTVLSDEPLGFLFILILEV